MFTGIIEELGTVRKLGPGSLELAARTVLEGTRLGDSIAVNGVCLTVTALSPAGFTADVMPETFRRTGLGGLHPGSQVRLRVWPGAVCDRIRAPLLLPEGGEHLS